MGSHHANCPKDLMASLTHVPRSIGTPRSVEVSIRPAGDGAVWDAGSRKDGQRARLKCSTNMTLKAQGNPKAKGRANGNAKDRANLASALSPRCGLLLEPSARR